MIVLHENEQLPRRLRPAVVTIGKFDGVHCGHRAIIARMREEAHARGASSVVVTFDRHPTVLVAPERTPEPIVSLKQKEELIAQCGVDATVELSFTRALSELSPQQFLEMLVERLGMRAIVVGQDFRFGHLGAGNVELLRRRGAQLGFDTIVLPDDKRDGVHRSSSTRVRQQLAVGDVRAAAKVLGRNHVLRGEVVHGEKRGRELGFPTANLGASTLEGMIPADGVYAGWLFLTAEHGSKQKLPAAVSIGNNPTFDGVPQQQVEAYVLDANLNLYGKTVEIEFVDQLREMVKFDSLEALIAQLQQDVQITRERLNLL